MGIQRHAAMLFATVSLAFLASCSDGDSDHPASTSPESAPLSQEPAPNLDIETSQADTPAGVVEARRWENTHVAAVSDDVYVAIVVDGTSGESQVQEAIVYLCDGEGAAVLAGELESGSATLTNDDLSVSFVVGDDDIRGDLHVGDEEPQPFTAEPAGGDAGLYGSSFAYEEVDYLPIWIVLPDGSQKGQACWQCCSGEGCAICCDESASTGGVTVDPIQQSTAGRLWDRFWDWVRN